MHNAKEPQAITCYNKANLAYRIVFGQDIPEWFRFSHLDDYNTCELAILCFFNYPFDNKNGHWLTHEFTDTFSAIRWFDSQYVSTPL